MITVVNIKYTQDGRIIRIRIRIRRIIIIIIIFYDSTIIDVILPLLLLVDLLY
jgi:hypothetical protein